MKAVALDIETMNLDMEADGLSFDDPSGWNTSVVSLYDHHSDSKLCYVFKPEDIEPTLSEDFLNYLGDWNDLAYDLEELFFKGYVLVTKNGTTFDLPIISKPIAEGGCGEAVSRRLKLFTDAPKTKTLENGTEKELTPRYLDICEYLRDTTGTRHSLQNLIHATFGEGHSKLMAASHAPERWSQGDYEEVIQYCAHDAAMTASLFYEGRREGRIWGFDSEGSRIALETRW